MKHELLSRVSPPHTSLGTHSILQFFVGKVLIIDQTFLHVCLYTVIIWIPFVIFLFNEREV